MRRLVAVATVVLAACTAPGVRTESAVEQATPSTTPVVTTTEPTAPPAPEPDPPDDTTAPTEPSEEPEEPESEPTTEVDEGRRGDRRRPVPGPRHRRPRRRSPTTCGRRTTRRHADPRRRGRRCRPWSSGRPTRSCSTPSRSTSRSVTVDGARGATSTLAAGEVVITPPTSVPTGATVAIDVAYTDQAQRAGSFAADSTSSGSSPPPTARTSSTSPTAHGPGCRATTTRRTRPRGASRSRSPPASTAVANGELIEQRSGADGDTFVWEQRQPMATYLVQLLTGDYEILDARPGRRGADRRRGAGRRRRADGAVLRPDRRPAGVLRAAVRPVSRSTATAWRSPTAHPAWRWRQQGRSLFSREDFPGGQPGALEHLLLSHELAHQWFGDAVSPADWSDLWLNESFATYAQWLWLDHVGLFPLRDAGRHQPGAAPGLRRVDGRPVASTTCSGSSATTAAPSSSTPCARSSVTRPSSRCSSDGWPTTTARRARRRTSSPSPTRSPGVTSRRSSTPGSSPKTSPTTTPLTVVSEVARRRASTGMLATFSDRSAASAACDQRWARIAARGPSPARQRRRGPRRGG